jgi:hypothetical protein
MAVEVLVAAGDFGRAKVRIATRQWLITHLMPKKHREQLEDNDCPEDSGPRRHLTMAEWEECMRRANA